MTSADFWNDNEAAQKIVDKISAFKSVVNPYREIGGRIEDYEVLAEMAEEEGGDSPLLSEAELESKGLKKSGIFLSLTRVGFKSTLPSPTNTKVVSI